MEMLSQPDNESLAPCYSNHMAKSGPLATKGYRGRGVLSVLFHQSCATDADWSLLICT